MRSQDCYAACLYIYALRPTEFEGLAAIVTQSMHEDHVLKPLPPVLIGALSIYIGFKTAGASPAAREVIEHDDKLNSALGPGPRGQSTDVFPSYSVLEIMVQPREILSK